MKRIFAYIFLLSAISCVSAEKFDATGTFEADEITVSAEASGKLTGLYVHEGDRVNMGELLFDVDSTALILQRRQLESQKNVFRSSRPDAEKQLSAVSEQLTHARAELDRIVRLYEKEAATAKQADDARAQVRVLEKQLDAQASSLSTNSKTIDSNISALDAQIASVENSILHCRAYAPASGTVISIYGAKGEFTSLGKPVLKIADLEHMRLRAYFTSSQLPDISVGQKVKVIADYGGDNVKELPGEITWIAQESEFTPKSVQTSQSRANLVYAVKIDVVNDGTLKLGLYGKVLL